MTPKEEYDQAQRAKRSRQMAQDEAWEARRKRDQAADECITVLLDGIKAFFEGHATLHLGPMQPGMGQSVRFIPKDRPPQ